MDMYEFSRNGTLNGTFDEWLYAHVPVNHDAVLFLILQKNFRMNAKKRTKIFNGLEFNEWVKNIPKHYSTDSHKFCVKT